MLKILKPLVLILSCHFCFSQQSELLKLINPNGSSDPKNFTVVNNSVFFEANDGTHGRELWVSDGTTSGTKLVKDINPNSAHGLNPDRLLYSFQNKLFFVADDGINGFELWTSDGTEGGTSILKDIWPGSGSGLGNSNPHFYEFNNELYFLGRDPVEGTELWKTDGTSAGTVRITAIQPGFGSSFSSFPNFTTVNNQLFFIARNNTFGLELWVYNGTTISLVKDINPGPNDGLNVNGPNVNYLGVYNDRLYFSARVGQSQGNLWISDGTTQGTNEVVNFDQMNINITSVNEWPAQFIEYKGYMIFSADGRIWRLNYSGTNLMIDEILGAPFVGTRSHPTEFTDYDGNLFFIGMNNDQQGGNTGLHFIGDPLGNSSFGLLLNGQRDILPLELTTTSGCLLYFSARRQAINATDRRLAYIKSSGNNTYTGFTFTHIGPEAIESPIELTQFGENIILSGVGPGIGRQVYIVRPYDTDGDGFENTCDECQNDPNKQDPGICGCGTPDIDSDGDGTLDCNDLCPNDPNKTEEGSCGCGVSDADTDNDGTLDCDDLCPNDPNKTVEGTCGCGVADIDSDNDGTSDCNDLCVNDPNKTDPGTCGCGVADIDTDNDGTPDCNDLCPLDPNKIVEGTCGCGVADIDTDNDGTPDCNDLCPIDPNKIDPLICGCGVVDLDTDNDGTFDCNDLCPNDPLKVIPGDCGCGIADTDTDNDGVADCNDLCPNDPNKTVEGTCGCGVADIDSDNDGTPDCNDLCPVDPNKVDPLICGCGNADTDSDGDGTADCFDQCPSDPLKTAPGQCGCGIVDVDIDGDGTANCNDLCPNDPLKIAPGQCGCGNRDNDFDNDGIADCVDNCLVNPNSDQSDLDNDGIGDECEICDLDPNKTDPGTCGCGVAETDDDGDGVPNCIDLCPNDPTKVDPLVCGCGIPETDSDNDGTPDCIDLCPNNQFKTAPGICGCGALDTDSDGDGTPDCNDFCLHHPLKVDPGQCGCTVVDIDTDNDGTADCNDLCPNDPNKVTYGVCGCGTPDIDSDNDGIADCSDFCPNDPNKISPGDCGCGIADSDSDNDGTPDCNDLCPNDASKTNPGICGCGVIDLDTDGDGHYDCVDNCPNSYNIFQSDFDNDGLGDVCDPENCDLGGDLTMCQGDLIQLSPIPNCDFSNCPSPQTTNIDLSTCDQSISDPDNNISVNAGSTICISTNDLYTGSITMNGGTLLIEGSFQPQNLNTGGSGFGEMIVLENGNANLGSLNLTGATDIFRNYGVTTALNLNISGTFENHGQTSVTGDVNINPTGILLNSSDFDITANFNINGVFTNNGLTNVGGSLNNNSSSIGQIFNNHVLNVGGNFNNNQLTENAGAINVGGNTHLNAGSVFNSKSGSQMITGGNLIVNGQLDADIGDCSSSQSGAGTIVNSGAIVSGSLDICSSNFTNTGTVTSDVTFDCSTCYIACSDLNYFWVGTDGSQYLFQKQPTISPSSNTSYLLTVIDNVGNQVASNEVRVIVNPPCSDIDNDGVLDGDDNCPSTPNADQSDMNNNGVGDACDISGAIAGPTNVCYNQTSVSYSVPHIPGRTYFWWSDVTTNITWDAIGNATVDFGSWGTSGTLTVGILLPDNPWYIQETLAINLSSCAKLGNTAYHSQVSITPNPFVSRTTVGLGEYEGNVTIKIVDSKGVQVELLNISNQRSIEIGDNLASGVYTVYVITNDSSNIYRISKI